MQQSESQQPFDDNQRLWHPFVARLLCWDSVVPAADAIFEEALP
jgi:hypothetical protein